MTGSWDVPVDFRALVDHTSSAFTVALAGRVVYANHAAEQLLGLGAGEAAGMRVLDVVHPGSVREARRRVDALLAGRPLPGSFRTTVLRRDGSARDVESVVDAVRLGDRVGVSLVSSDVTERLRREERLAHLALHDPLTGLPNRVLLLDRLEQAFSRLGRGCAGVLVLFVDLDGFKLVNDTYGHAAGDDVLRWVADALRGALRESDTVGRLGGDEFVVCADLDDLSLAGPLRERVVQALSCPVVTGGGTVAMGASAGGVVVVEQGGDPLRAIAEADRLMYEDKVRRRGGAAPRLRQLGATG